MKACKERVCLWWNYRLIRKSTSLVWVLKHEEATNSQTIHFALAWSKHWYVTTSGPCFRWATYLKETPTYQRYSHAFQERMTFVLVPQQPQSLIMVWRVLSLSRNSVCNFPGRRRKHFVLECKDRWMACVYWGMGRNLCKLEVNGARGKLLMLLTGRNQRHLCCNSCMNRAEKWQGLCMIHLKILTNACGVTSPSFRTHGCRDVIPGVRTREFIELQSHGVELRVRPSISCRFRRTSGKVAGTVARFAMFLNLPTWTVARCENKRSYFCFLSTDG